ncbi:MAG: SDR family NAD(P)-dependent oxidoreductase [Mycobacterium sp.]|nr:SDR family NAD(P)-dependent oxidoreductase [Mycobacterium sp.]
MTDNTITSKNILIAGGAKNLGGLISRDVAAHGARAVAVHYNSDSSRAAAEEHCRRDRRVRRQRTSVASRSDQRCSGEDAVCRRYRRDGFDRHRHQHDRDGDQEAHRRDHRRGLRQDLRDQRQDRAVLHPAGRRASVRRAGSWSRWSTSLLSAYTGLYSIYAGSKAPVEHFTRAAAKEFGERGISVTAVAPGPMETPFFYGQESHGVRGVQPERR